MFAQTVVQIMHVMVLNDMAKGIFDNRHINNYYIGLQHIKSDVWDIKLSVVRTICKEQL